MISFCFLFIHGKCEMNEQDGALDAATDQVNLKPTLFTVHSHDLSLTQNNKLIAYGDDIVFRLKKSENFKNKNALIEYRLLGHNYEWKPIQSNRIEFSKLNPGNYCFECRLSSDLILSNLTELYLFEVDKPIWAKYSFSLFILSFLLVVSLTGISIYTQKLFLTKKLIYLNHKYEMNVMKSRVLHSMMNPHFIFNNLNSLQYYISNGKPQKAGSKLNDLSKLIRKNLEISQNKFISINDEISFLKLYLTLENDRLDHFISFNISHDDTIKTETFMIPSLMIQPLIENSIKHGIIPKGESGEIDLKFIKRDSHIEVIVTDNGIGYYPSSMKKSESNMGMSLQIIKERLSLMKDCHKFEFQINFTNLYENQANKSGTKVRIKLPLVITT